MPIARDQVPVLIKAAEVKKLPGWKADYFAKIARELQVHTKGQLFAKVDTLFPNEHPDSKAHCLATYEPITKSSIWKGINNLQRIFSSSSFTINVGEEVTDYLDQYEFSGHNLLNYFLEMWVHKAIAEDPNGLFVIYPPDYSDERQMCPVQYVRSELIKSITPDAIAFISEMDSQVDYYYETATTKREVFYDQTVENMNARTLTQTTYNQRLRVKVIKEVVHVFTRSGIIIYNRKDKAANEFDFTLIDFAQDLTIIPAFAGGGPVADSADQLLFESVVHPFVPFGNLALLQHRNHRAVDLQFSYPRMSELQVPCDQAGCASGRVKCAKSLNASGFTTCPKCKGAAFITVQSPYKVYTPRYDPNDTNENKHLQVDPVKFFSPDVGIINYSKDAWKDYLKMAEEAIFITQKVYTGMVPSAESKGIDQDEMFAWINNSGKVFYNNLRSLLQCLEEYMSRNPIKVSVERPTSFAILTENEAFTRLNAILTSTAPIFVKANQVEGFVNKFVSKDSPVRRALRILKKYDPLLFYSITDIQTFKGANVITQEMWTKNTLAYPVLLKLYQEDKTIFDQDDELIMREMDKEISDFNIAPVGSSFRESISGAISRLGQPGAEEGAAA